MSRPRSPLLPIRQSIGGKASTKSGTWQATAACGKEPPKFAAPKQSSGSTKVIPTKPDAPAKVLAYFERGSQQAVTLEHRETDAAPKSDRLETPAWFGRLTTVGVIELKLPDQKPAPLPCRRSSPAGWRVSGRKRTPQINP